MEASMQDGSALAYRTASAGAAWLDEKVPGWAERIDLDRLSITSRWYCVLGQIEGHYDDALHRFGLVHEDAMALGFTGFTLDMDPLQEAWVVEVESRQVRP